MAIYTAVRRDEVVPSTSYQAPREASGVLASRRVSPDGYSLWLCESDLGDGATIRWGDRHGEDVVYVLEGELEVDGRRCPRAGAVVVEGDVPAMARAIGPTIVAHFGPSDEEVPTDGRFGPPVREGRGVHVVGPNGQFTSGQRESVHATWYADSTCDTCRIQLLKVESGPRNDRNGPPHHHTEDEIIYLIEGSVRIGATVFEPRTSLAIPGMARYALTGGADGHAFLNYRRDVSEQVYRRSDPPLLETGLARGGVVTADVR